MGRDIRKYELKKIFTSPIVLSLMGIFLIFNAVLIFSQWEMNQELRVLTRMVERYGHEINDEALANWEAEHERLLEELSEALGRSITSATLMMNSGRLFLSDEEMTQLTEIAVLERYLEFAPEIDEYYRRLDFISDAERKIVGWGISGELADTVRTHFQRLQLRLDEVIDNHEHMHFFFDGLEYEMHSFLFGRVLGSTIFGITTMGLLITSFLLSHEFDAKTYLLTYSTKCGRKLQLEKLKVALMSISVITLVMVSATLAIYFIVYDYSGLWSVPMSSAFKSEGLFFIISAWNMTFLQYLLAVIMVIWISQLLFVLLVFCLSKFIRSGYLVTITFAIIFGFALVASGFLPMSSNVRFYADFNPFSMITYSQALFLLTGTSNLSKYYEIATIGVWSVLLIISALFCYRRFNKSDLH